MVDAFLENQDAPAAPTPYGPYVAEGGRIGWGMAWESVAEDLAEAIGKPRDAGTYGDDPEFEAVWSAFFTE